jgi:hypothetical protein
LSWRDMLSTGGSSGARIVVASAEDGCTASVPFVCRAYV